MPKTDRIFYDGYCGLSHHAVTLLLRIDSRNIFRFAPIQGQTFSSRVAATARNALPDSMVVQTAQGRLLTGPAAWIHVLHAIGGFWQFVAAAMKAVPAPLSQAVYRLVARTRYLIFGRRVTLFPEMSIDLRSRFDN